MDKKGTTKKGANSFAKFLRKNLYYILLILSLLAIGIIVTIALTLDKKNPVIDPPHTPVDVQVTMLNPISADYEIITDFSQTKLVFFSTVNARRAHKAVDFAAAEGTEVVAVLDGTVTKVGYSKLLGGYVKINHGNGLETVYKSLNRDINLKVGDVVARGDVIGTVSNSMGQEKEMGPHLHFEVWESGKVKNPHDYLGLPVLK